MDYRLYFFRDSHIVRAVQLDCRDDQDAIRAVADHADGGEMELWQRARMVKRFGADEGPLTAR